MNNYKLVNPTLLGSFKTVYTANTAEEAAAQFWKEFTGSNLIAGNLPFYAFSFADDKNKLYHFSVKEKPNGTSADYEISELKTELSRQQKKIFLDGVDSLLNSKINEDSKHIGGKKDDSSSSSSSSSSDEEDYFKYLRLRHRRKPIYYYWYDPSIYKVDTLFFPTFIAPISPYVHLYNSSITLTLS
jgi:hypothetical protein